MGLLFAKLTPFRATGIFLSTGLLAAYAYDKYECMKLDKDAFNAAKEMGEAPLDQADQLSRHKRLILFWTVKNHFYSQYIRQNFSKYAGKYLTSAGIDYEMCEIVLSKASFPSRIPGTSNPTFDQFVEQFYASKGRYIDLMDEVQEPKQYAEHWSQAKTAQQEGMLVYSLNEKDSVLLGTLINGIIPCSQNESFFIRIAKSFVQRKKLEAIIQSTFSLIHLVNQSNEKKTRSLQ